MVHGHRCTRSLGDLGYFHVVAPRSPGFLDHSLHLGSRKRTYKSQGAREEAALHSRRRPAGVVLILPVTHPTGSHLAAKKTRKCRLNPGGHVSRGKKEDVFSGRQLTVFHRICGTRCSTHEITAIFMNYL